MREMIASRHVLFSDFIFNILLTLLPVNLLKDALLR
jgi:hypothetical protein